MLLAWTSIARRMFVLARSSEKHWNEWSIISVKWTILNNIISPDNALIFLIYWIETTLNTLSLALTSWFHLRPFPSTCQRTLELEFSAYFFLLQPLQALLPFHQIPNHTYYLLLAYKLSYKFKSECIMMLGVNWLIIRPIFTLFITKCSIYLSIRWFRSLQA